MSLKEVFESSPWRSFKKFYEAAKNAGFNDRTEIKRFYDENIVHQVKVNPYDYYLPIYSKTHDAYQFDTLVQSKKGRKPPFLIFINVNTRKAFAYIMKNKGTKEVLRVLQTFVAEHHPTSLTSDQDSAYLSNEITEFLIKHNVTHYTTEDHNHNILGIINRFIRTLRDLNKERDFTEESMNKVINAYNKSTHNSTGFKPNQMTSKEEDEYIKQKRMLTEERRSSSLLPGTKVRIILEHKPHEKVRNQLSDDYYIVDSSQGNGYLIKAADHSVAFYPRFRLVESENGRLAKTVDEAKRGIVNKIVSYDEDKDEYTVIYEGGVDDKIPSRNLRESNPTHLSELEKDYWKDKNKPKLIKKFL
ncbi:integrase core domain containing protein family [Trichomonas vaginalis G3]|uniref:integrase core domain containing protein family n=1 Tax=Trichomonas vaginalis (strain ATCC PRA-98 / G3) TaxID=412133 RepID=UPI0021E5ECD6|nr:integrase core domain containing protein family [Trichomonas vaginalis G3]KAI5520773.1 integrase core domain containing protein family [Trichomonas vaginalis G3]